MSPSSRTPEGSQGRCPLCRRLVTLLTADPLEDAPCPACGTLIWPVQGERRAFFLPASQITPGMRAKLYASLQQACEGDSLGLMEVLMDLESIADLQIPDEVSQY